MHRLFRLFLKLQRLRRYLRAPVTMGSRVLVIENENVLLVRLTYSRGWYLPGGGVDRGESFADAAARELVEECGVHADKLTLFGLYLNRRDRRIDHVAVYLATQIQGTPRVTDTREIAEVKYFPINALPEDLWPGHKNRVLEYLGQQPYTHSWTDLV